MTERERERERKTVLKKLLTIGNVTFKVEHANDVILLLQKNLAYVQLFNNNAKNRFLS